MTHEDIIAKMDEQFLKMFIYMEKRFDAIDKKFDKEHQKHLAILHSLTLQRENIDELDHRSSKHGR